VNVNLCSLGENLIAAKSLISLMETRASVPDASTEDRAELSVLTTTTRKVEELLSIAHEYEDKLVEQMLCTRARIGR
jgi:hypothetical protein